MLKRRIVLVDFYTGQHGVSSRIDITGEAYIYVNLNSTLSLREYLIEIIHLILYDIHIDHNNCRLRFSFSGKNDQDILLNMIDSNEQFPIKVDGVSKNNFQSLHDLLSYSNKFNANYCFIGSR